MRRLTRAKRAACLPIAAGCLSLPAGLLAGTVNWTGGPGGSGTSWNAGSNWDTTSLPQSTDDAAFSSTGLTASKVISLDAPQTITTLDLNTSTTFTIGTTTAGGDLASGNTLTLNNVSRTGVSGGTQTLAASIVLNADSAWTVSSGDKLVVTGTISGGHSLTLSGGGELDLATDSYTGTTTINAGTLKAAANGAIQGNLVIGDGTDAASFGLTSKSLTDVIANSANVTVNNNATLVLNNNSGEHFNDLTVNGGTAYFEYTRIDGPSLTMTGGTITPADQYSGSLYLLAGTVTTNAAASMASIYCNIQVRTGGSTNFAVADGTAAIDLKLAGGLVAGSASFTLNKSGAGVMELTGNTTSAITSSGNSSMLDKVAITGGTLLVDNTAGSGTGQSGVSVNATTVNATLGGTGFIGGVTGYSNANVTLTGTSSSINAMLAPGTIDPTSGAHVIGTLSVGGANQSNNVTFNNNSSLVETLAAAGSGDQLAVTGNLTLASGATLNLTSAPSIGLADGTYTWVLATFTGTLTGRFGGATLNGAALPSNVTLEYLDASSNIITDANPINGGSIVLVPEPCSIGMAGGGVAIGLLSRRRRRRSRA